MPDPRKVIDEKFWTWLRKTYKLGFGEVGVRADQTPYWNYFWATQLTPEERNLYSGVIPTSDRGEEGKKEYRPGAITDEQYQAWLKYQKAGGQADFYGGFYEWIDAGMPTITEEQANTAWLQRLNTYLANQVSSGNISQNEADVIWNDTQDRLFAGGKYVGKRQTFNQLPAAILSDVERYWTGLPIAAQREAEAAAKTESQRLQDVALQRMQLPLYAGGTQTQQINAGQQAIRNLKIQMEAAPPYLQAEMRSQILSLEESINQISSSVRLQARQTTRAQQGVPEEGIPNQQFPGVGEPGSFAQQFAEEHGMSPEAASLLGFNYRASLQNPEQFPEYQWANMTPEQRAAIPAMSWVGREASGPQPGPAPIPPYNPPEEFAKSGAVGSPVWKSWFSQYYPSIVSQFTQGEGGKRRTAESWSEFLMKERTRLKEQFASQGAYSRAERPGYFAPKLKTVAF